MKIKFPKWLLWIGAFVTVAVGVIACVLSGRRSGYPALSDINTILKENEANRKIKEADDYRRRADAIFNTFRDLDK